MLRSLVGCRAASWGGAWRPPRFSSWSQSGPPRREARRPRAVLPPRSALQGSPAGSLAPYLTLLPQRAERRPQVLGEERRLFPRREVPAFVVLLVVDQVGIRPLRPAPRGRIELVGEDAHGHRDGGVDALDGEERRTPALPVEAADR